MSTFTVADTCCCGAVFKSTGYVSFVSAEHKDWLAAHETCRLAFAQPMSRPSIATTSAPVSSAVLDLGGHP